MKTNKLPRKLKKECKKTVMLWILNKSKDIRITNFNRQTRTFQHKISE